MQPGHIHLLIFLLGLAVLAAFAWLVAWLIGFPEWATLVLFVAVGVTLFMALVFGAMWLTDVAQRYLLDPVRASDSRGNRVALQWERERLDASERKSLMSNFRRVVRLRDFARAVAVLLVAWPLLWAAQRGVIAIAEPRIVETSATTISLFFLANHAAFLVVFIAVMTRVMSRFQQILEARALPFIGRCGACTDRKFDSKRAGVRAWGVRGLGLQRTPLRAKDVYRPEGTRSPNQESLRRRSAVGSLRHSVGLG